MTVSVDESWLMGLRDRLSLAQKVRLLTGQDFWSVPAEPAIGLRSLVVSDGPAGVRGTSWSELSTSVSLPSPTSLAASWDVGLVRRVAGLLAQEARRKGVDVVLGPTVNLHRSPLGGRHFECLSEDPLLTAVLGTAYVHGLQDNGVGATAKHYVGNESETERFTVDIRMDERTLRELYLAPFELMVLDGGAWLVMAAYNSVHGATMTENPLLTHPLKDEWGFDGVVISDWVATRSTSASASAGLDLVMPGPEGPWGDALIAAVQNGTVPETAVDDKVLRLLRLAARVGALGAEPPRPAAVEPAPLARVAAADGMVLLRNNGLLPLANPGRVAVIGQLADDARTQGGGSATVIPDYTVSPLAGLRNALDVTYSVGVRQGDGLRPMPRQLITNATGQPGFDVHWLTDDGTVLRHELRHAGHLVWLGDAERRATTVRISGRFRADAAGTWQLGVVGNGRFTLDLAGERVLTETLVKGGDGPGSDLMDTPQAATARELAEGAELDLVLTHHPDPNSAVLGMTLGVERPHPPADVEFAEAIEAAKTADVAVVVVGTTEAVESEGFDRHDLALPDGQDDLVRAIAAANPRTVVVVNSGGPVLLPWRNDVDALLLAWFGGQEMGAALADVLLGVREPGGRLPTTWPAAQSDALSTTPTDGVLHYTEGLHIGYRAWLRANREPAFPFGHGIGYTTWEYLDISIVDNEVTVKVRNTGSRHGKEVVQVYLSRSDSAIERPARWLAGFAVVTADPGTETTATITLPARTWQHWSVAEQAWATEPGTFTVAAGRSVADLPLRANLTVS
ncbi:MAG TPA: glycoside hydrolase family 3 C-terminal domain-containing protein [Pseudonocardiaceae bacterium]|nr:glycoside hydrolase family 3 C-terminal domain-containing protein [Pseudonocardiaceae bacterium]